MLSFPAHTLVVAGQAITLSIKTITETSLTTLGWYKNNVLINPSLDSYNIETVKFNSLIIIIVKMFAGN